MSEEPTNQPTPEDVKAYLEGKKETPSNKTPTTDTKEFALNLDPNTLDSVREANLASDEGDLDIREGKPRISIDLESSLNTDVRVPIIADKYLELSQDDKEGFLKCVMLEEHVVFDVRIPAFKDILFKIRAKTAYEQTLCYAACHKDADTKEALTIVEQNNNFKYYSAIIQFLEINGVKPSFSHSFKSSNTNYNQNEDVEKLRQLRKDIIDNHSNAKWLIYFSALSVFDAKLAKAAEGLANEDFFNPVE